ncbi:putative inactive leucine-rich repeat receptor kinase XIAO, partial [Mucuna pruriens]
MVWYSKESTITILGNLSKLEVLKLSNSSIDGAFPNEGLCKMKQLQELDLSRNHFRGTLDICLGNLTSLQTLDLSDNLLIGSIPTSLSNHTSFRYFDISGNNLEGIFPNWLLVNNPKLEVVHLNDNSFTGPFELPFDLNHKMEVTDLDLSNNQIQGKLPQNIGFLLTHLENFDVSGNMFDGPIPDSIVEMSSLVGLFLRDNNFSGKIPEHIFSGCTQLNYLMMDNNHLNGTIPTGIGKLNPAILTASWNNLEGTITKEFCNLELDIFDLRHNKFSGELPSCLKMPSYYLFLQGNSLSGTINEAFINSSGNDLQAIDLSDNKFRGTIPESIYGLKSLRFLLLAGNHLHGQLSSKLCQLQKVDILDLSRNNFTGSIPSCLNNSFGKELFSSDYVPGFRLTPFKAIPDFTAVQLVTKGFSRSYQGVTLEYMSGLDLSCNQLTGEIPQQIGDLYALHALNLSHNHLSGPIPESFQKLESIESLDLSNNNLSGQIPLQLQDLHSLAVFNVSYNNLSGKAPHMGQFGTFDESSYKGNPSLTWNNSNRGIPTPAPPPPTLLHDGEKRDSAIDFTAFFWSFASSYVMVLIVLGMILWINPHWRRSWFYFVERCCHKCFGQFLDDAFY